MLTTTMTYGLTMDQLITKTKQNVGLWAGELEKFKPTITRSEKTKSHKVPVVTGFFFYYDNLV
jgi:hypothetical protein